MRVGLNPQKDKASEASKYLHQIIIPVFIPNNEGYFKDSFKVLELCLQSLIITSHSKTYISVINNGSCGEVHHYLDHLLAEGKIHELVHTTNVGKINAVLKGLTGNKFSLITVADADVLFLNNWQKETYRVFEAFPKVGAVSPVPSPRTLSGHTENIYCALLFSKSLQFRPVKNPAALKAFADSVGTPYNKYNLQKYLTISQNGCTAVVGAGHFVVTYKCEVFDKLQARYTSYQLGGTSEQDILDKPVVKNGLWRVATEDNFAYHMGNVVEPWMIQTVANLTPNEFEKKEDFNFQKVNESKIAHWAKYRFFGRIIMRKEIFPFVLRYKGLSKKEANGYKLKDPE